MYKYLIQMECWIHNKFSLQLRLCSGLLERKNIHAICYGLLPLSLASLRTQFSEKGNLLALPMAPWIIWGTAMVQCDSVFTFVLLVPSLCGQNGRLVQL